jgi:hypothetical protein
MTRRREGLTGPSAGPPQPQSAAVGCSGPLRDRLHPEWRRPAAAAGPEAERRGMRRAEGSGRAAPLEGVEKFLTTAEEAQTCMCS